MVRPLDRLAGHNTMSSIPMGFSPKKPNKSTNNNNITFILCFLLSAPLIFPCGVLAQSESTSSSSSSNIDDGCPSPCICKASENGGPSSSSASSSDEISSVSCSGQNLTSLPLGLPRTTRKLELERNLIDKIDSNALLLLGSLKELTLSRNYLTHVPHDAILPQVQILNLAYNRIRRLNNHILKNNSKLHALILSNNLIEDIDEEAFVGLRDLYILELNDNRLTQVPNALAKLTNLHELNLANNHIVEIATPFHKLLSKIVLLELKGNPFQWIHSDGFAHLRHLKKLILSDVKNLTVFPHLNGTSALEILRIDRCSLHTIPHGLCSLSPKLKSLDLKSNKIDKFPSFEGCSELKILDVGSNEIQELEGGGFQELSQLHDLHLSHNLISRIPAAAFHGLSQLRALDLSYNNIDDIHPDAFLPTTQLEDLNVGNNYFSTFPSSEFSAMAHLKIANNPNLREFPGPESFPKVRTMVLSFAYHCCQFTSYGLKSSSMEPPIQESVYYPTDKEYENQLSNLNLAAELWPGFGNFSSNGMISSQDFWKNLETAGNSFSTDPSLIDDDQNIFSRDLSIPRTDIQCIPLPGPFLPCNDLFDWWTLRCGVWVVFLLALMGNGTVVFVLIFARTKMDVPRFLVCNLAIADFFMGVYLGFLAVVDAATLGEFRRFAIPWQLSRGCQMAGFLGVLSSELSVYTLAVITMERHYAITHAMHLNKRLSLRHASYIMIIGWIFAMLMAILPLFGVSDYRKFAVCLPFETGDAVSMSYVVFLMFANGVAFTILMGCYLKMYCSIRGSQAWNSNDTRIAKRMALLVFTDLLCWFPIAFFSLTAVFGLQLVSLEEAKVFTVFILPLNSCCNPFLYAILTKQFKKDCVLICKAIEESRVTRGIGRCRHSSNFSNRQTAANTGSLVEKSSKDGQPCICHAGLHPTGGDVNGNAKYRFIPSSERWSRLGPLGRFFSRYILCQNNSKEANRKARDDYRMRNVRRFLYNSTPGNYPPDAQKHKRHASVSSDNFSSSRSDSWRVQGRCGLPSRLLEPRRRNSWAVTRKPSQDSNLSSSRNDSSATSNSTATWRLSRSSVSSDAASHSGGGKSSLKRIAAAAASTHNYGNIVAARNAAAAAAAAATATAQAAAVAASATNSSSGGNNNSGNGGGPVAGGNSARPKMLLANFQKDTSSTAILLPTNVQQQQQTQQQQQEEPLLETSRHCQKASQNKNKQSATRMSEKNSNSSTKKVVIVEDDGIIDDDELSAKIATNRPRLVRQSAFFSDEVVIEPEICPVHGVLIPGTYDNEEEDQVSDIDELDEEDDDDDEGEVGDPTSPILRKPNNANPYSIALVIVPRRLSSTISSRDSATLTAPSIEDGQERSGSPSSSSAAGAVTTTGVVAMLAGSSSSSPHGNFQQQIQQQQPHQFQFPGEIGRRKMSEQPVKLYVLPSGAVVAQPTKWHSMSSVVEVVQGETQPQIHVVQSTNNTQSSSSPSGDGLVTAAGTSSNDGQSTGAGTSSMLVKGETRDPQQERRVSFQLPPSATTSTTTPTTTTTTNKSAPNSGNIVNPTPPQQQQPPRQ